jgi:hypothetical protein|uniref:Uncharacterized protein n=1 Tax=Halalkalibacterium halodurans TaxID=86665 RepID=A0A0M0KJJ6_ALKHA
MKTSIFKNIMNPSRIIGGALAINASDRNAVRDVTYKHIQVEPFEEGQSFVYLFMKSGNSEVNRSGKFSKEIYKKSLVGERFR